MQYTIQSLMYGGCIAQCNFTLFYTKLLLMLCLSILCAKSLRKTSLYMLYIYGKVCMERSEKLCMKLHAIEKCCPECASCEASPRRKFCMKFKAKFHEKSHLKGAHFTPVGATINHWLLESTQCRPGQCILQAGVYHC